MAEQSQSSRGSNTTINGVSQGGEEDEIEATAKGGDGEGGEAAAAAATSQDNNSVKLFVGQVPKSMTEAQLRTLFEEQADIEEVTLIKDKLTKASRGCCFVICPSREEADKAVNAFHNKRTLPGASSPLQVKYADGELERLEHKLFIGMLPKNVSDSEVSDLFSKYGSIKDLQILRGSKHTSKAGCAFLKYEKKEEAVAAIEDLNGKYKMEGSPVALVIKWADSEKERLARKAQKSQSQSFGASNASMMQHHSLLGTMQMGYIPQYNGFGYQTHGAYGVMQYPITSVQNQAAFQNVVPPINQGNAPRGVSPEISPRSGPVPFNTIQGKMNVNPTAPPSPSTSAVGQIEGPPGANLFIYHIPQEYGDQELAMAFSHFGRVLSSKVYIDKITGVSKCFGFVSYDSPASAQTAINVMNGCQLGSKRLKVQLKRENKHCIPY